MSSSSRINVVLIGYGQISKSQHAPILKARTSTFQLCAIVDPALVAGGSSSSTLLLGDDDAPTAVYSSLSDALTAFLHKNQLPRLDAAVIACPPAFAQDYAEEALKANLSVFMEKPPGQNHRRLIQLQQLATENGQTLYTAYHSTMCPEMTGAKEWLTSNNSHPLVLLKEIRIEWKESAAKWHPGQVWIKDGFGVLDILCNPLSMLEELLGCAVAADITIERSNIVIPTNWSSPVAGSTTFTCGTSGNCPRIVAEYAWDHNENDDDVWSISFQSTQRGRMELRDGGAQMFLDGVNVTPGMTQEDILRPEYDALYDRFVQLMENKECEVRIMPLRIMNEILEKSMVEVGDEYVI